MFVGSGRTGRTLTQYRPLSSYIILDEEGDQETPAKEGPLMTPITPRNPASPALLGSFTVSTGLSHVLPGGPPWILHSYPIIFLTLFSISRPVSSGDPDHEDRDRLDAGTEATRASLSAMHIAPCKA